MAHFESVCILVVFWAVEARWVVSLWRENRSSATHPGWCIASRNSCGYLSTLGLHFRNQTIWVVWKPAKSHCYVLEMDFLRGFRLLCAITISGLRFSLVQLQTCPVSHHKKLELVPELIFSNWKCMAVYTLNVTVLSHMYLLFISVHARFCCNHLLLCRAVYPTASKQGFWFILRWPFSIHFSQTMCCTLITCYLQECFHLI